MAAAKRNIGVVPGAPGERLLRSSLRCALRHQLNIDFVNEAQGSRVRVAVELSEASARSLVETILAVLEHASTGGYLDQQISDATIHDSHSGRWVSSVRGSVRGSGETLFCASRRK